MACIFALYKFVKKQELTKTYFLPVFEVPNSVFYTSLQFVSGVCAFFHVQYHEKHHIHRNIDEHYGSERHAALI